MPEEKRARKGSGRGGSIREWFQTAFLDRLAWIQSPSHQCHWTFCSENHLLCHRQYRPCDDRTIQESKFHTSWGSSKSYGRVDAGREGAYLFEDIHGDIVERDGARIILDIFTKNISSSILPSAGCSGVGLWCLASFPPTARTFQAISWLDTMLVSRSKRAYRPQNVCGWEVGHGYVQTKTSSPSAEATFLGSRSSDGSLPQPTIMAVNAGVRLGKGAAAVWRGRCLLRNVCLAGSGKRACWNGRAGTAARLISPDEWIEFFEFRQSGFRFRTSPYPGFVSALRPAACLATVECNSL